MYNSQAGDFFYIFKPTSNSRVGASPTIKKMFSLSTLPTHDINFLQFYVTYKFKFMIYNTISPGAISNFCPLVPTIKVLRRSQCFVII